MSELQTILQDLARGRIDAETAQRKISALTDAKTSGGSQAEAESTSEPEDSELGDRSTGETGPFRRYTPPPPPKGFSPWNWVRGTGTESTRRDSGAAEGARRDSGGAEGARRDSSGANKPALERIEVRGAGQRIRLIGDPSVATVSVDGPHTLRRNGMVLEIRAASQLRMPRVDPLSILRARSLNDVRQQGLKTPELVISLNPSLLVDVELSAGSLTTTAVPYLGRIRVSGGTSRLEGVAELGDALFQMGQASVLGTLKTGRSRIRVETGQATIELGEASNVTVRGQAQLGKVSLAGAQSTEPDELVVGLGNARLDIEAMMAYIAVKLDVG